MPIAALLKITPAIVRDLHNLRKKAKQKPIDMITLVQQAHLLEVGQRHAQQLKEQTITIPGESTDFAVTFTIETGRHLMPERRLRVGITNDNHLPSQASILRVAQELGFNIGLTAYRRWVEREHGHITAINIIQPVTPEEQKMLSAVD
jgi:hypothetical protein